MWKYRCLKILLILNTAILLALSVQNLPTTITMYSNPIDEYFITHIDNADSEAERCFLQDTYRGVWKSEFENVMSWIMEKCHYQEDIDLLAEYADNVNQQIKITRDIMVTDWLNDYELSPNSPRNIWGNGTRSGLSQVTAELYRDAAMLIINHCGDYSFRDIDYSLEHYE